MHPAAGGRPPRIAVIADFLEENWPSMDLAAEQLAQHLSRRTDLSTSLMRPPLRVTSRARPASSLERALGRFIQLPVELAGTRFDADCFHIADHSYGHLALLFPARRVGIYCHDIDAFRALLPASGAPPARRLLSWVLLRGLRHAHVVFHSTASVRDELIRHDLVPAARLVQAPLGIAAEFLATPAPSPIAGPYLLHVGSCTPRKNVEMLLRIFTEVRARIPGLKLVQIGGRFTDAQRSYVESERLELHVQQRSGLSRDELASVYSGALAVLVPSLAEGFGIPVVEALACGAPVIASDIPVLREVGFDGVRFCSLTDVSQWTRAIEEVHASGARPSSETRARIRTRYTWQTHAQIIGDEYLRAIAAASSSGNGAVPSAGSGGA